MFTKFTFFFHQMTFLALFFFVNKIYKKKLKLKLKFIKFIKLEK